MTGAPAPQVHTITFWANGFTVDDGPLRNYDDPANTAFMQAVGRGECPRELEPTDRATPININLVKKETDYEPPPEPKPVTARWLADGVASRKVVAPTAVTCTLLAGHDEYSSAS